MNTFPTHFETLPQAQRALWLDFAGISNSGFVLYGGTALALRLAHRTSIDYDFFSSEPLDRERLVARFPFLNEATTIQDEADTLSVLARRENEDVKVSFFGNLRFGRVGAPELTDDHLIPVASIDDLFGTKLKVLLQRTELKDYLDVAALIASGARLERGLAAASALFGAPFQPAEALRALTYFEGGDIPRLSAAHRESLERAAALSGPLPSMQIQSRQLAASDTLSP